MGVVWLACTTAGIQNYYCAFHLYCSLFYQNGMLCRATSSSRSPILLVVSQQTSSWSLLFSHLECSVEQVLAADPSSPYCWTLADYWLWRVWIISKCHGHIQVINWIAHAGVGGYGEGLNKFHGQYRYSPGIHHGLTTQFADLADIAGLQDITTGWCLWFVWLQQYS